MADNLHTLMDSHSGFISYCRCDAASVSLSSPSTPSYFIYSFTSSSFSSSSHPYHFLSNISLRWPSYRAQALFCEWTHYLNVFSRVAVERHLAKYSRNVETRHALLIWPYCFLLDVALMSHVLPLVPALVFLHPVASCLLPHVVLCKVVWSRVIDVKSIWMPESCPFWHPHFATPHSVFCFLAPNWVQ